MRDCHRVAASEADEAVADIDAVWCEPDPSSRSERSVRVIGDRHSRRTVLTIILVHCDDDVGYWRAKRLGNQHLRSTPV